MDNEQVFDKEKLEKELPEASEVEVLKDNAEDVFGFHVKPWGFDEIEKLTPVFELIFIDLKKRKILLKDFYQLTKEPQGDGSEKTKIELLNFDQLYFAIMPNVRAVFKITLHITDDEISRITPEQMPVLFLKIVMQNVGYLKNWLALVMALTARTIA